MIKTAALISAVALIAGLGAVNSAQAAPVKHPAQLASKAQLAREHARAMKAGDQANDPYNPASSNSLNQQQLAKAGALPAGMPGDSSNSGDVQPGAINSGATNTSGVDAATAIQQQPDATTPAGQNGTTNGNDATGSNVMPPQSPPVNGTTPDTQNTPQATTPQADTSNNMSNSSPQ